MATESGGAETVGTARLDLVVDTSQFDAAINQAKRSVSGMSTEAQAEYNKLNAAEKRRVNSLIQQADRLKLTREQQIAYNAALRGTPTKILDDLKVRLAQSTQGTQALGMSQKQLQAALRGTPAQITDIITSLQGGQRPITVLLQQGGQLKDMFGGIGPAARGLAGAVRSMVSPFTLAAAAVGALGFAWNQAQNEANAVENALVLTGNRARLTADDVETLLRQLDRLEGVTRSNATTALAQVVTTGRFVGEQIDIVTQAAVQLEEAGIQSIDKTIDAFVELGKDPVRALLKLNETQGFLTREQVESIETLQEQGREFDAVTEAMRIYADRSAEVSTQVRENTSAIAGAFKELKGIAAEAWDEVVGIYRGDQVNAARDRLATMFGSLPILGNLVGGPTGARTFAQGLFASRPAAASAAAAGSGTPETRSEKDYEEERREAERALREFESARTQSLTRQLRLEQDITEMKKAGAKAGKDSAEIAKVEADMRARFAEQEKRRGGREKKTDPTEGIVNRLKQQIALNQEQLKTDQNLTASERMRIQVEQELERIGGKATGTKRALIDALLSELTATGQLVEQQKQELKNREALARQEAILAAQRANRRDSNEADLLSLRRGEEAIERVQRLIDIEREYTDELKRLGDRSVADDQAAWDRMAVAARAHRDQQLVEEADFQRRRAELLGDWQAGYARALEDYVTDAENVNGQVYELIGGGLGDLEDQIVGISRTGKFAWRDMILDWGEQATRFATRQVFADVIKKFAPGLGEDGEAAALSKSAGELAASGTVLVGAAAALSASATALAAAGALSGGAGGGASGGGGWASLIAQSLGGMGYANGGVFGAGTGYTNKVVDRPTVFPFANGIGLMGEAGPEAIMPLRRLPSGRLGVEAAQGAAVSRPISFTVNVPVYGKASEATRGQIANEASRELRHAARLTG